MSLSQTWNPDQAQKVASVRLFGTVKVKLPGQSEKLWRSHKAATVLGYLACKTGSTVARSELVDRFWPDSEPKQARASLRQLLYELKRMLEPPGFEGAVIQSDNNHIWIVPGTVSTDVQIFDTEVDKSRITNDQGEKVLYLNSAVEQFSGPFLESVDEPWALHERSRYDNRYCSAVCELTDALCARGDATRAVDVVQRALQYLPLRQDLYISAMRAYAAAGEINEALRQFDTLTRVLDEELGEEPSELAKEVLQNLPGAVRSRQRVETPVQPKVQEAPSRQSNAFPRFRGSCFVGRRAELAQLVDLLDPSRQDAARIVTVTGPGGTGKTRLAAEALEHVFQSYSGRTCVLTDTENLTEAGFWAALATALRPDVVLRDGIKQTVVSWLAGSPALIMVDDCDLMDASLTSITSDLISELPGLRLLLTSRSPVGLENEQAFRIGPLDLPTGRESLRELLEVPSVRLFWESARKVEFSFQLTSKNAEAIVKLCQNLDGLPLAIMLAAGRISVFRPQQMLERLMDQKAFLRKRERTGPAHHHSLEAALLWTFESLSNSAKQLLPSLSAFRSGFNAPAAEHVFGHTDIYEPLEELVTSSWLIAEEDGDNVRFGLLNSIAQFASGLRVDETLRDTWEKRHTQYYDSWLESRSKLLGGPDSRQISDSLLKELPNLRLITERELAPSQGLEIPTRILDNLRPFFELRGHTGDWLPIAKRLLGSTETDEPQYRVRGLLALGMIAFFERDFDTMEEAYKEASKLLPLLPKDPEYAAATLNGLGLAYRIQNKPGKAIEAFQSAINEANDDASPGLRCKIHFNLGITVESESGFQVAFSHFRTAADIAESAGLTKMLGVCISSLVRPRDLEPTSEEQMAEMRRAMRILDSLGDERASMYVAANLGLTYYLAGEVSEAVRLMDQAIRFDLQDKEWRSLRSNLAVLAMIMAESRHEYGAEIALEAHERLVAQIDEPLPPLESEILARAIQQVRGSNPVLKRSRFSSGNDLNLDVIVQQAIDDSLELASRTA